MLNYTKSSFFYILKNFWYIILLSVIPALCLGGMTCIDDSKAFFTNFFTGKLSEISWTQIFNTFSLYRFTDVLSVLFSLFSFLLLVLCASMLLALIDKHMRIGKRTLNGVFEKLNDNVMSTFCVILFFSIIYEVWTVIFSSLTFLIFSVISVLPLQYILFVVLLGACVLALLYVISLFYLWLPCMQITGFEAFEALRYTNQITEQVKRRIILSMTLSLLAGALLLVPAFLFFPKTLVYVVLIILYTCYVMLFLTRMEVIYFDAAQMEREDLKKYHE